MELFIDCKMPTLNEFIAAQNRNRYIGNSMKQKYTNIVFNIAKSNKFKIEDVKHDIEVTWFVTNFKSDPDNIASGLKFVLDGLVKAESIKNDGHKQIGSITHHFKKNSKPGCTIKFSPHNK